MRSPRIRGNRERELNKIQPEAYWSVEEIRGVADANATEIYASAYNQSPEAVEFYEFIRTRWRAWLISRSAERSLGSWLMGLDGAVVLPGSGGVVSAFGADVLGYELGVLAQAVGGKRSFNQITTGHVDGWPTATACPATLTSRRDQPDHASRFPRRPILHQARDTNLWTGSIPSPVLSSAPLSVSPAWVAGL
jgi:hypothetical protein